MLNNYRYDLIEGWSKLSESPLCEQGQESWDDYLKLNGYYPSGDSVGHNCGWEVTMRSANDKSEIKPQFPYLVEIGNAHEGRLVFCEDFLSAADLVRQFAPLATAEILTSVFESLEATLRTEQDRTEDLHRRWKTARG